MAETAVGPLLVVGMARSRARMMAVRKGIRAEPLLSVLLLERLLPVDRREFEHATLRPGPEQAQQVPQVRPRLDAMQATAREQRHEDGVHLRRVVLYSDQLRIIAELDRGGNLISRFVYGERPNVPEYMVRTGITYRIVTDHLGSVRLVVAVDGPNPGSITQRIDYDAFGLATATSGPAFQPFGFAGGLLDSDTNLVTFGRRHYESATGRFTARDPTLFHGNATNLYAYAANDPVNATDPTGLRVPWFVPFVGGSAGQIVVDSSCKEAPKKECEATGLEEDADPIPKYFPLPEPGAAPKDADAIYMPDGTTKIPDNYTCTISCEGGRAHLHCDWRWYFPGKKAEFFPPGAPLPPGFLPNPHVK